MSPIFVNDNPHPIRVDSPNELTGSPQLQRVLPGQVVEADGKYADNLGATEGVREGSSDELEAYRESLEAKPATPAARLAQKLALPALRLALRRAATVAPLQRVVGDDAAPYGPPSGEVTTAMDAARASDEDRRQFMNNDVLPEESIAHAGTPAPSLPLSADPSSEEIHNAQAAANAEAEELADKWIEVGQSEPADLSAHFSPAPPEREAGAHEGADHFDAADDEYEDKTQEQLAEELESRGLAKSGTKDEQIARLRESDAGADEKE